jgi:tetratricopeptide (TPR) repeat protein
MSSLAELPKVAGCRSDFEFDVFLSHSSKDKVVVRSLAERLREDGLKVWFDDWVLKVGDSIPGKIEQGLEQSRVLVLCMSANAFGSDWAKLEADTIRFRDPMNKERRLIPLRLDDAPIKGSLAQFLYTDWRVPANRDLEYTKLLAACQPTGTAIADRTKREDEGAETLGPAPDEHRQREEAQAKQRADQEERQCETAEAQGRADDNRHRQEHKTGRLSWRALLTACVFGVILFGVWYWLANLPLTADRDTCLEKVGEEAISACTRAINSHHWQGHELAVAYTKRGDAYRASHDSGHALADYNEAIRLDPKYTSAYNGRGIVYDDKKDYDRALADYNEAIGLDPKYAPAYSNRALVYYANKDYDRAFADLNERIRLDPKYALAYINRGAVYVNKKDYDSALADFNEAIRLNPNDASAYYNRGATYSDKKDYDRALADYSEAIRLDADTAAYDARGYVYYIKKNYDRALADYNEAIRLDPKYAPTYRNRGIVYRAKNDNDRALADFNEAIRLDPNFAAAYYSRGLAKKANGNSTGGDADITKAKQLDANVDK